MTNFLTGFTANIIATTICQPIDVLKINYQINPSSTISSNLKSIWSKKSMFRGLAPNLGTYPIFWGVYFPAEKMIKNYIEPGNSINNFLISYLAGNAASLVSNPLFVLKVRMQTSKMSYAETIRSIYKTNKIAGFYSGFPATAVNNLKLGFQFPLYNFLKNSTDNIGLSSGLAKGLVTSVMYPMDLVRTYQRSNKGSGMSILNIIKKLYKENGLKGLYRGVLLYNCVSVPQFIIMMYVVESLK